MKQSVRNRLSSRQRRMTRRIDKANWNGQSPMLATPAVQLELAERTQALSAGGIGTVQQLVRQQDVAGSINRRCPFLQFHLPYSEADHVLNIAFNLLAGGSCLEHLELRRNDEAYLDALGAQRIPDPTTAGDFCRRFSKLDVFALQEALHEPRIKVWQSRRMDFRTFCQSVIPIPAQIINSGRRLIYRLLTWTPGVETLFRVHECVSRLLLN